MNPTMPNSVRSYSPTARASTIRNILWAKRHRKLLIERLGGKCIGCGETNAKKLEFNHPYGRDYDPSKLSRWERIRHYRRDADAGRLNLLCSACNKKKEFQPKPK